MYRWKHKKLRIKNRESNISLFKLEFISKGLE